MRVNLEARAAAAEQRKAQTRERLLDAAIAVIGDKGPQACSIEDFVVAAQVSRGTFYNYFPTAEDLLRAVQRKIVAALAEVLDARLPASMSVSLRLATRLHSYILSVSRDPAWGWMMARLDGSRLERTPILETNLDLMFYEGVSRGEFRDMDPAAVRTLVFGSSRMLQRDILMGLSSPEHTIQVVALVLTACGLTYETALATSREGAAAALEIQAVLDAA
jgi:AcrR family transcriptional regulator